MKHDDSSTRTTVREAVFDILRQVGVSKVFGNPGSTELGFLANFPPDFEYVLGLQESVAVAMADGYAQATHNAGFVSLHSAAGVGHAMGNVFTAFKNQTPLVLIAGQQSRSLLPHMPFLFSNEATELPKPYVKWSIEPATPEDVPQAIARAYHVAMTEPRGPVLVSVCADDWSAQTERVAMRTVSQRVAPDPAQLDALHTTLAQAKRPAIIVGGGVDRAGAWADVVRLAEIRRADVWEAPKEGRRSFPEDHPLFKGFLPAFREQIVEALTPYDVLLVLGAPVFLYHTPGQGPHVPASSTLVQIVDSPEIAAASVTGTSIIGSIDLSVTALLARESAEARRAPFAGGPARVPPETPVRLNIDHTLNTIARLRPRGSIIVEEATSARVPIETHLPILEPESFYTTASGGLGFGLPAAVGVALGRPGKKVVAVLGDGSSMYSIQGLWTAARLQLPITFIILVNRSYAVLRKFGPAYGLSGEMTFPGFDVGGIQFAELARSLGCGGARVDDVAQLPAALTDALQSPKPTLLEVILER